MNNTCFACGTVKNRKSLGFDPNTLKSYCLNENICNPDERPDVTLFSYENIPSAVKSAFPGEKGETLAKLATKAAGVRLHPYLAMHLVNVAEEYDLQSVNEALLFIVHRDYELNQEIQPETEFEKFVKEVKGTSPAFTGEAQPRHWEPTEEQIKVMINEKPSMRVLEHEPIREIEGTQAEPEEKEEEEEEFTF